MKYFTEVPQITDVLDNPTIRQEKKEQVIDKVFPREMRNFLKIVCRYRKVRLLGEILTHTICGQMRRNRS